MIRIAFMDVDGTLLSHKTNDVSAKTKEAINLLQAKGIKVFVCSGRSKHEFYQMSQFDNVCFDGYIFMGGALSIYQDEIISEYPVAKEDIHAIYDFIQVNPFPIVAVEESETYINMIDDYAKMAYDAVHTELPKIKDYSRTLNHKIYQYVACPHQNELDVLSKNFKHMFITSWNPYGYDLVHDQSGKENAIKDVCRYFGYSLEDSLGIGDGENDIDMLQTVGTSIAMGNAIDKVKEICDYVTEDIDEEGLYKALRHYKLI